MATQSLNWRELSLLSDEELARHDIAAVNLSCAVNLPGTERMDYAGCLKSLDRAARYVAGYTARVMNDFRRHPEQYENSEPYFRVMAMLTGLHRGCGFRYNPDKVAEDAPFDAADTFIFGAIHGGGGTCSTLPVVFAAVGRRLGYPIKLVTAYCGPRGNHRFARWEGADGTRFNIEGTSGGLASPTDDYYRTGRYAVTPAQEAWAHYLRSKTPRHELARFIADRAIVCKDSGDLRRCVEARAFSAGVVPEIPLYDHALREDMRAWRGRLTARVPAQFPQVLIKPPPGRVFPAGLPVQAELDYFWLRAVETMLDDPELDRIWARMRAGGVKAGGKNRACVEFRADGTSEMTLQLNA